MYKCEKFRNKIYISGFKGLFEKNSIYFYMYSTIFSHLIPHIETVQNVPKKYIFLSSFFSCAIPEKCPITTEVMQVDLDKITRALLIICYHT